MELLLLLLLLLLLSGTQQFNGTHKLGEFVNYKTKIFIKYSYEFEIKPFRESSVSISDCRVFRSI